MRSSTKALGVMLTSCLCFCTSALAWNKSGHMVSGAIAYRDLKESSPETIAKVVAILKEHPNFTKRWEPELKRAAVEDRDLTLFMLAARWPDDARGTSFDRPAHHFVDFPLTFTDDPNGVSTVPPPSVNLISSFKENVGIVKGGGSAADKAVALAWIFHQVGDVHQPLHTVSLFTNEFVPPEGDRGGTRFFIRATESSSTISLHKFWDDLILGPSVRPRTAGNRATLLLSREGFTRSHFPELSEKDFEKWAKDEGNRAARQFVYREGHLEGGHTRDESEVLPEDYADEVKPFAEHRVTLAGYRLADILKELAP